MSWRLHQLVAVAHPGLNLQHSDVFLSSWASGAMRKVLTRKVLKVLNFKNMAKSGPDSLLKVLEH